MKDSKEYSSKIEKLYRSIKRKYSKPEKPDYQNPIDAIVFAAAAEYLSTAKAKSAVGKFSDYFVDFNDMRVSRPEEIIELVGMDQPNARDIAENIIRVLSAIFRLYHIIDLEPLKKMGKRPAKQILEKLDGSTDFIINYFMLTFLQAHTIPLTDRMVEYLKENELVHPSADKAQIRGFLAKRVSSKEAYTFYALLREESEAGKKQTRKTKAVKKASKKKTGKTTKSKKAK